MECPVCGAPAVDITRHDFEGKSIRCDSCSEYDIERAVHITGVLNRLELDERRRALLQAKAFAEPNKRPMISMYTIQLSY